MRWDSSSHNPYRFARRLVTPHLPAALSLGVGERVRAGETSSSWNELMGRAVRRHWASGSLARPGVTFISAALIAVLTQCSCSSFSVHGPSPEATAPAAKRIAIAPNRPAVRVNEVLQLTIRKPVGGVRLEEPIVWSSDDMEVLAVVSLGERARITGISPGAARVTVNTANGYTASVMARVYVDLVVGDSMPPNKPMQLTALSL